jgi:predicted dehydrogenase
VLCEKPLCATLADWDRLDEAARRAGRTVSTVFQWRFGAAAQHLKRLIGAGSLGALHVGLCATLWYRDAAYYAVEWRARRDSAFGGVGMAMGIHLMDLLLWLCPAWTGVQAWTATRPVPHMQPGALDVENLALAHIHFADGSLVSAINSAVSPRQTTLLRLDFARATVEVSALYRAANADWTFTPVDPADVGLWTPADAREDGVGDLAAQVGALLDSLARGEPPLVTGAESRRIVEFLTCLYASARTGTPVTRGSLHS